MQLENGAQGAEETRPAHPHKGKAAAVQEVSEKACGLNVAG